MIWDGSRVLDTPFLDVSGQISARGEGLLSTAFHPGYADERLLLRLLHRPERRRHPGALPRLRRPERGRRLERRHPAHHPASRQREPQRRPAAVRARRHTCTWGRATAAAETTRPATRSASDVLLGKLLRLDVDPSIANPPFYAIPAGNPFVGNGGPDQAWAKGLRNPWRFSFDRATGDLYIGDVGQGAREEVDFQPAGDPGGENYGWKVMEGTQCGNGDTGVCPAATPPCHDASYVLPILDYAHDNGNCTVIGGYVYRGASIPDFYGQYIYGDTARARSGRSRSRAASGRRSSCRSSSPPCPRSARTPRGSSTRRTRTARSSAFARRASTRRPSPPYLRASRSSGARPP